MCMSSILNIRIGVHRTYVYQSTLNQRLCVHCMYVCKPNDKFCSIYLSTIYTIVNGKFRQYNIPFINSSMSQVYLIYSIKWQYTKSPGYYPLYLHEIVTLM